jgi:beta-glucosidase
VPHTKPLTFNIEGNEMSGLTTGESSGPCRFPANFVWGASTSAYQTEGAVREDGRGRSIWDAFSHTPGKVQGGDTGDIACDSYHRTQDDLRLLGELGVGAYRFSIAWPRVQPIGSGKVNQAGLDYYRRLVHGLLEAGIMPMATIYHWELPQALEDRGGWAVRETAERFAEYAHLLAQQLGDQIRMWITLNEPLQSAHQGYRVGSHAPGRADLPSAAAATHHLLLGHGLAMQAVRAARPGMATVGIALDPNPIRAFGEGAREAAAVLDAESNRMYLDPVLHGVYPAQARPELLPCDVLIGDGDMAVIGAPLDFLGINYYRTHYVRLGDWSDLRAGESPVPGHPGLVNYLPPDLPRTIMDWLVEPSGLYEILMGVSAQAPQLPLYITENGYAAEDYVNPEGVINDFERIEYLHGHLDAAWCAIQDGVKLAGYFHWSLMDNFEWSWGYRRRFGLYFVDFGTQRRLPKRSAAFYAKVARTGELPARDEVLGPADWTPRSSRSPAVPIAAPAVQRLAKLDGAGRDASRYGTALTEAAGP